MVKPSSEVMSAAKLVEAVHTVGFGSIYGESAGYAADWLDEYQRDTEEELATDPGCRWDSEVAAELEMIKSIRRYFNVCHFTWKDGQDGG
jgi:hypothetical protein